MLEMPDKNNNEKDPSKKDKMETKKKKKDTTNCAQALPAGWVSEK